MATNTPILGLKKPVPNVEENWAFRLNESLDILDQSLLVGNASSKENVTTFNDGVGHLVISGSTNPVFDHVETITFNAPYITVTTGTFTEVNVGGITNILGTEITTTSGIFDEVVINGVPLTAGTPVDQSFTLLFTATDRKAANTDGGTFTSGAWRVRTLNSVDSNELPGASLASNTITLTEPGEYYIDWSAPAYRVNRHKSILYNVTDSHTELQGSNEYAGAGYLVQSISVGGGKFTIDKPTDFQIWHRCESTFNTQGLGVDSNFGVDEIYTQVSLWPNDSQIVQLKGLVATSGTYTGGLTVSGAPVVTTDSFVNVAESPLKVWSPDAVPENGSAFDSEWNSGDLSGWTTWNVGGYLTADVEPAAGALRLRHDTPSSTSSVAGIFRTAPTSDFTIYTKLFYHNNVSIDFHEFGIIVASGIGDNPSTANMGSVSIPAHRTGSGTESYSLGFATQHFTQYDTFDRNLEFHGLQFPANEPIYLKIHVELSTRIVTAYASRDGLIWGDPVVGDFSGDFPGITEIGYWINSTIDPELIISSDFFRVEEHIDASQPLPGNFITVSGITNPVSLENIDELSAVSGTFSQALTSNGQTTINLPADKNFLIDGATNQREITVGAFRQLHTPAIPGTRALNYVIDMNNQADTSAIVTEYTATGLATTSGGTAFKITVDTANSTGGTVEGYHITAVGSGTANVHAVHVGPGVAPLEHESGAFGNIDTAFTYDDSGASFADVTASFESSVLNTSLWDEDDDLVYIGEDATFSAVSFILDTPSSGPGIKPEFEFWDGAWSSFGPFDGTNGMRVNGTLTWHVVDLSGWTTTNVNGATKYWIRIRRTANSLTSPPVEELVQRTSTFQYNWDADGNVNVNTLTAGTGLTVSGIPVNIGEPISQYATDPSPSVSGTVWINTTTSGIRWNVNGTVFEVQGTEV